MKAIAFATVALIATISASIEEYSDTVARRQSMEERMAVEARAQLINANIRERFCLSEESQHDGFLLNADSVINPEELEDDNVCGRWLGINLVDYGRCICNITRFKVEKYDNLQRVPVMYLKLDFESHTTRPMIPVEIPVYKIPSSVTSASQDPQELRQWAERKRVGLLSPVDEQQLTLLKESHQLTLNFTWFADLLQYGIKEGRLRRVIFARPLVLSNDAIDKLIDAVDWFKDDVFSVDSDDLARLDGLADLNVIRSNPNDSQQR